MKATDNLTMESQLVFLAALFTLWCTGALISCASESTLAALPGWIETVSFFLMLLLPILLALLGVRLLYKGREHRIATPRRFYTAAGLTFLPMVLIVFVIYCRG